MKISDLMELARARLASLNNAVAQASRLGDAQKITALQAEIDETQATIASLQSILE